jgi:hypothetical protein
MLYSCLREKSHSVKVIDTCGGCSKYLCRNCKLECSGKVWCQECAVKRNIFSYCFRCRLFHDEVYEDTHTIEQKSRFDRADDLDRLDKSHRIPGQSTKKITIPDDVEPDTKFIGHIECIVCLIGFSPTFNNANSRYIPELQTKPDNLILHSASCKYCKNKQSFEYWTCEHDRNALIKFSCNGNNLRQCEICVASWTCDEHGFHCFGCRKWKCFSCNDDNDAVHWSNHMFEHDLLYCQVCTVQINVTICTEIKKLTRDDFPQAIIDIIREF